MITASHNPPEYNGIKFIPDYAGPATPEITEAIEKHLNNLQGDDIYFLPEHTGRERGLVRELDAKPFYFAHLQKVINYRAIHRGSLKIVFDPMWGAGRGYLEELLKGTKNQVEVIHNFRDVLFGGYLPDPNERCLAPLRDAVLEKGADIGLALDGDADRFGVIDQHGEYYSPNRILRLSFITFRRPMAGAMRTVATTHMLDRIVDDYGLPLWKPRWSGYIGQS